MSNVDEVGQMRRRSGISMNTRMKEHTLACALVVWKNYGNIYESTYRQMIENMRIRLA